MRTRMKCAVVTVATVSAAALAAPAASAQPVNPRSQPHGRVCLFDAPREPADAGHIGWAYRWSADHGQWDYGATVGRQNGWRKHGSFAQMVSDFRKSRDGGGYTTYRCTDTLASDQRDANALVNRINGKDYNLVVDNCLTKAIQILKAYDESGGLNALPVGKWTIPNYYYAAMLDKAGWDRLVRLH
ncbi:opacity protein-like surface antigen [Catenulispora sp. GP43]|uniref:hypothetical protein n=1 Tax=Catenulispora sp. GP43 TaxID=3156263 RepID=UPI003514C082